MQVFKREVNFLFLVVALWPGFFFDWLLEWGLVFFLTGLGLLKYLVTKERETPINRFGLYLSLTLVSLGFFAYLNTVATQRFSTSGRDLLDLLKPILLYFSSLLPFIVNKKFISRGEIENSASIILWYSALCFFAIQLKVPFLGDLLTNFYSETKTNITDYIVRLTIPFENPNFLGLFSVTCLYIGLNLTRIINWLLAVPALICIALSGSRTAWALGIASIAVFIFDTIFTSFTKNSRLPRKYIILSFLVVILFFSSLGIDDFIGSYQRLADFIDIFSNFDLARDESYADRIALRDGTWKLIEERPIFGWGAVKESGFDVVDNQFYGIALRYGIFGTFIFLMYAIYCFFIYLKKMHTLRKKILVSIYFSILFIWLWTGSYLENIRLVVLQIMLLYSIGIESEQNRSKCSGNREK